MHIMTIFTTLKNRKFRKFWKILKSKIEARVGFLECLWWITLGLSHYCESGVRSTLLLLWRWKICIWYQKKRREYAWWSCWCNWKSKISKTHKKKFENSQNKVKASWGLRPDLFLIFNKKFKTFVRAFQTFDFKKEIRIDLNSETSLMKGSRMDKLKAARTIIESHTYDSWKLYGR